MGNKWATVSIDDIKLPEKYSCVGGPFGSSLSQKHYVDSGVPVIRGTNLAGDIFSESDFVFVSPDKANELQRNMAFRGDIVFTQRGTLGQVALIPEDSLYEKYIVSQSQMKLTVNPKQADAYFIYTYFRTNEAKALIENNAIIGGVPHINLGILKEFKLRLPPLSEQKRISEVSKSIDNKINLNRQINQTLEQMSQTLFKSWFVDFDPVIDNALDAGNPIPESLQSRAELRQKVRNSADFKPLPADIRALFPAEFEEAESGWVPMGWKDGSLPDIAFINPTSWGTKNQPNYVNYVDLSNAKDGIISSIDKISFKEAPSRARRILKKDDLIFGLVRPANRSFAYVHIDGLTGSTGFAVIRAKNTIYKNFIYYFVTYDKNVEELARIADGGAYPAIKPDDICSLPLIIPSEEIVQRFDELTSNFRYLMNNSLVQNDFLTALRDTLLPKLISGELPLEDLPDLIKQTEAA